MNRTKRAELAIKDAIVFLLRCRKEYLTPEMLLWTILSQDEGRRLLDSYQADQDVVLAQLLQQVMALDSIPEDVGEYDLKLSSQMSYVLSWAEMQAEDSGREEVDIPHLLRAILMLTDSYAKYTLLTYTTTDEAELFTTIIAAYEGEELPMHVPGEELLEDYDDFDALFSDSSEEESPSDSNTGWQRLVTCISDLVDTHNPLIGREAELERTIQVLCRKDKNNPLHVGEPGVGKTALVYGLAALIQSGSVPERLRNARIYQMDMGAMVAGTSYRGDFEKRIKAVMEGAKQEGNAIIYIDEIHTLVGTGTIGDSSLDGSNILKPYLESGEIRFIGSTTYQEYNRSFQKSKGLVRRFQQIDIQEPSVEDTIHILEGLKSKYEEYHGVKYDEGVIAYAVEASAKYINDRFLPDKAIDLIDEAAAYRVLHPKTRKYKGEEQRCTVQLVDRSLVNDVLARICKVDPKMLHEEHAQQLETLYSRISGQIYGQDPAVHKVVEAVEMGSAGLLEDGKPIASLLFVGPTGVGKTEVCKVLAKELGIELVRFDMSEYTEKHTVAKLIGSPAGYVGYEDGGLLTDAIRKTPHCVLLLDEIEKAHSDIYNILLQVMDYATLSDNKGQKADFRHVILVLTSNAGAQYAHQASIGFGSSVKAGEAMLTTVRKTFKPEFLARLSDTVVFNDMDETMASMILDKKLGQLFARLASRQVKADVTPEAKRLLLTKGFSQKLGAREMDRQINQLLAPLLTREILYGRLRKGGSAVIDVVDGGLEISEICG